VKIESGGVETTVVGDKVEVKLENESVAAVAQGGPNEEPTKEIKDEPTSEEPIKDEPTKDEPTQTENVKTEAVDELDPMGIPT
jgi:hypothetical protein